MLHLVRPPARYLETDELKVDCDFCEKKFTYPGSLYTHQKIHFRNQNATIRFLCPVKECRHHNFLETLKTHPVGFAAYSLIKQHYQKTHSEKSFLCEHCVTVKYSLKRDLRFHEKRCPERLRKERPVSDSISIARYEEVTTTSPPKPPPPPKIVQINLNRPLPKRIKPHPTATAPSNLRVPILRKGSYWNRFNQQVVIVAKPSTTTLEHGYNSRDDEAAYSSIHSPQATPNRLRPLAMKKWTPTVSRPRYRMIAPKAPKIPVNRVISAIPIVTSKRVSRDSETQTDEAVIRQLVQSPVPMAYSPNFEVSVSPTVPDPKDAWAQTVEQFIQECERSSIATETIEYSGDNQYKIHPDQQGVASQVLDPVPMLDFAQNVNLSGMEVYGDYNLDPSSMLKQSEPSSCLIRDDTSKSMTDEFNYDPILSTPSPRHLADFFCQTYHPEHQDASVSADLSTMWSTAPYGQGLHQPDQVPDDAVTAANDFREAILLSTIETQTDDRPSTHRETVATGTDAYTGANTWISEQAIGQDQDQELATFEDILRNMETQTSSQILADIETQTIADFTEGHATIETQTQ